MAEVRHSRSGVSLLEVMIAVAMASTLITATVYELRQLLWVARENHRMLVADSFAWDVVWRAYNAQGWSMPPTMTNSELSVGYDSSGYRLSGARILARGQNDGRKNTVSLSVCDGEPLPGSRNRRYLTAEVSWINDDPLRSDYGPSSSALRTNSVRRVGLSKPVFERSWLRVEQDVDASGGGQ